MNKTALKLVIILAILLLSSIGLLNSKYISAQSDVTPPSSTIQFTPSSPDGLNGWYKTPIEMKITSDDLESGVKSINWYKNSEPVSTVEFNNGINQVTNPSFETSGSPIDAWSHTSSDGATNYTQDPTPAPSLGSYSAKISTPNALWHSYNNKDNFVVASPLQNMTASVWIKTTSAANGAKFKMYVLYDNAGTLNEALVGTSTAIIGTQDWTKVTLSFTANHTNAVGVYMEAGMEGAGDTWFDGATISANWAETAAEFTESANGTHTMRYYAIDNATNTEITKNTPYKIDTKAPSRWTNFDLTQSGNNHTFIVRIDVSDFTSGLDVSTAEYQYSTDEGVTWGYNTPLTSCNNFTQGWKSVPVTPNTDGSTTVTLTTTAIDFCNSNWTDLKKIRFRIYDMAGNVSQSPDFTINGAWIRITNGDVYSNHSIAMLSNSEVTHVAGAAGAISNMTSAAGDYIEDYDEIPFQTYQTWYDRYKPTTTLPSGRLPTTNGRYYVNSDFTIASGTIPSNLATTQNLGAAIFINGDLNINSNYALHNTSGLIFIVKGDVTVRNSVTSIDGFYVSDGVFDVGTSTSALTVRGGVTADFFILSRSLNGSQNTSNPAEIFIFDPKYFEAGKASLTENTQVTWFEVN